MPLRSDDQPADVERENILGQELGGHGRVKHRGDVGHGYGGVGHPQNPIEPRHREGDARLLHRFTKLLSGNRKSCNLRGETPLPTGSRGAFNETIGTA